MVLKVDSPITRRLAICPECESFDQQLTRSAPVGNGAVETMLGFERWQIQSRNLGFGLSSWKARVGVKNAKGRGRSLQRIASNSLYDAVLGSWKGCPSGASMYILEACRDSMCSFLIISAAGSLNLNMGLTLTIPSLLFAFSLCLT
jgi:hypothetical protein